MPTQTVDFDQLTTVNPGDNLVLRFNERAAGDLIYVQAFDRAGVIKVDPKDALIVAAIADSGSFGPDENRNLTVTVGEAWDYNFFAGRMRRALESLEVTKA